jgi:hypothetical protein
MRVLPILLLGCAAVVAAIAAPLSPAYRTEIDALMSKLETSGCEVNRNGTWHTGSEAKPHLLRKLQYFEEKGTVQTTEQFIELVASRSSSTGQPYLIRCGNGVPVPSGEWFSYQLKAMRSDGQAVRARRP